MSELKPAAELAAAAASKPYPGDSADYRRARTALLTEEIELRRHIERVAALRRTLPLGGEVRDPGQDPRGAPDPTPLWNILDLTPAGRGTDWYPTLG